MKNSLKHIHKFIQKTGICACGKIMKIKKKKELKKGDKIEIEWVDSMHISGWLKEDKITLSGKELFHKTLGYFLKEDKTSIIVYQSYQIHTNPSSLDAIMEIPKVAIKQIKRV